MAITIKKVSTKRELKKFIRFNYELYKENPYSVPDLYDDMLNTFNKKKNAAFEFCEAEYFLAYKDGKIVGRIAGIINHRANATWNKKDVRFGWIDFIDDLEVSSRLLQTVEEWGKSKGMETSWIYRLRRRRYADRRIRPTQHHGNHLQSSLLSATHGETGI